MKKILTIIAAVVIVVAVAVGCAPKQEAPKTEAPKQEAKTEEKVLVVDKDKKEIKMQTEVNAKYFTESTRHGVVFKGGSNGEKSILRGLADEKEFDEALLSLGAQPGKNVKGDDKGKGVKVEGSTLDVFVTWEGLGKEIPFNDIVSSSDPRPMQIKFGGNIDNAKKFNTGCVLCLDSCPVGITSNSSYTFGESDTVKFYGKKDVLPKDGTKVTVIFRLAK